MTMDGKKLEGSYTFENGKFIPQGDMTTIEERIAELKLLADAGSCSYGSFYYDPINKKYWHYVQYDDYRTYLKPIKRSEIEGKYPTVDCDHLLDVKYE